MAAMMNFASEYDENAYYIMSLFCKCKNIYFSQYNKTYDIKKIQLRNVEPDESYDGLYKITILFDYEGEENDFDSGVNDFTAWLEDGKLGIKDDTILIDNSR